MTNSSMKYRWNWFSIAPMVLVGCAIAVPLLLSPIPALGFALQRGFSLVCHQQPARSFFLFGGSIAVCARCLGIYLGAAVGLLVRVERRTAVRFLTLAAGLNGADWLAELAGLHGNWMLLRFVLGIVLGTAAAMVVVASSIRELPAPAMSHQSRSIPRERI